MYPGGRLKFGETGRRGYAACMPTAPSTDARQLATMLEQAGQRALEFFRAVKTEYKQDGSEVTAADLSYLARRRFGDSGPPGFARVRSEHDPNVAE